MARRSSKSSGSTSNQGSSEDTPLAEGTGADTPTVDAATEDDSLSATSNAPIEEAETLPPEDSDATVSADTMEGSAGDNTLVVGEDSLAEDAPETVTPADDSAETVTLSSDAETLPPSDSDPTIAAAPVPVPTEKPARRGPGFVPLVLGGVVAAGIGYGAAYMGWLPVPADDGQMVELSGTISAQTEALAALEARVTELANAEPALPELPEVDFSPVLNEIDGLSARMDEAAGAVETLANRVTVLEERPVFTGNVDEDSAAMAETVDALEAELRAQQEEAEVRAAELQAEADAAAAAAAEAETRANEAIATAEAEAQAELARAEAEAALSRLRMALNTGSPFAEDLNTLEPVVEIPEALRNAAETGVPTLTDLQESFPEAARAALPVGLRETAGEGTADRVTAFLRGHLGGRAIEPLEGDDPDAILSRVNAAVEAGDLITALEETATLPEGARAEMADWAARAETRREAEAALAEVETALSGTE